jgi:HlyD family secretion protein
VDVNDRVRKNQVLVELDTKKLTDQVHRSTAALAAAQAQLLLSQATVREAQASLARLEEVSRLSGGKVPSATELDVARATADRALASQASAAANVDDARALLSTDQTNLSKASIRSPIDGVVLTRSVDPGNAVAASLQAVTLFSVAEDLAQLHLEVRQGRAKGQLYRQRLPCSALPGHHHPGGLRLHQDRQRGHLHHLHGRGQHRPEPAAGHDSCRRHRLDRAH